MVAAIVDLCIKEQSADNRAVCASVFEVAPKWCILYSAGLGCLMAAASWKLVFGVAGASAIGSNRSVAESHCRACARTRSFT